MFNGFTKEVFSIGPFNSDGTATHVVGKADGTIRINSCEVFNLASAATHATAYVTMTLINLATDGAGTTVIASASTSQTGGAAVPAFKAFPLTITAANATLTDGQALGFVRTEQNTDSVALAGCTVVVRYTQLTPCE